MSGNKKEGMDYSDTLGLFFTVKQQGISLTSDGVIDDRDLTILWMAYNYYSGEIIIQ